MQYKYTYDDYDNDDDQIFASDHFRNGGQSSRTV